MFKKIVNNVTADDIVDISMCDVNNDDMKKHSYHHGDLKAAAVKVGLTIVEQTGEQGLSIRSVAREIGVDARAIYRHFASKEDVLLEIATTGFEMLTVKMTQELTKTASNGEQSTAVRRFVHLGEQYVIFGVEHPRLFELMFRLTGQQQIENALRERKEPFEFFRECWVDVLKSDHLPTTNADQFLFSLWSAVHGVTSLTILGHGTDKKGSKRAVQLAARNVCNTIIVGCLELARQEANHQK